MNNRSIPGRHTRRKTGAAVVLALLGLAVPCIAQTVGNESRWGQAGIGTMASIARHRRMLEGVPSPYRAMHAPTSYGSGTLARGAAIFSEHCAACHGSMARGNGPRGRDIYPNPADLTWLAGKPARQAEPFMFWSIAEGGAEFGSDMPAFKSRLSRGDIWAVIGYIREPHRER